MAREHRSQIVWAKGALRPFDSEGTLGAKFCRLNYASPQQFSEWLSEFERETCGDNDISSARSTTSRDLLALARALGEPISVVRTLSTTPFELVGEVSRAMSGLATSKAPGSYDHDLWVCKECLSLYHHSHLHQANWLKRCYWHGCELVCVQRKCPKPQGATSEGSRFIAPLMKLWFDDRCSNPALPQVAFRSASAGRVATGAAQRLARTLSKAEGQLSAMAVEGRVVRVAGPDASTVVADVVVAAGCVSRNPIVSLCSPHSSETRTARATISASISQIILERPGFLTCLAWGRALDVACGLAAPGESWAQLAELREPLERQHKDCWNCLNESILFGRDIARNRRHWLWNPQPMQAMANMGFQPCAACVVLEILNSWDEPALIEDRLNDCRNWQRASDFFDQRSMVHGAGQDIIVRSRRASNPTASDYGERCYYQAPIGQLAVIAEHLLVAWLTTFVRAASQLAYSSECGLWNSQHVRPGLQFDSFVRGAAPRFVVTLDVRDGSTGLLTRWPRGFKKTWHRAMQTLSKDTTHRGRALACARAVREYELASLRRTEAALESLERMCSRASSNESPP